MAPLRSLRATLLLWLLLPLAAVAGLDTWAAIESALRTATLVQDRLLLGSARAIAERVQLTNGAIVVTIPPAAIEALDAGFRDRVYYRVIDRDGRLLAGTDELGAPAQDLKPEEWTGFDAHLAGHEVRVVAFLQPLFEAPRRGPIRIQVAQTLNGRNELARTIWLSTVRQQSLILLLVAALVWFGLRRGLKPLTAIRDRILKRPIGAIELVDEHAVPTELEPLVAAINNSVTRLKEHMLLHSRFLADASHQMRTPLTVLNTQIAFAMRHEGSASTHQVLHSMRRSVRSNIRLVNQLLAVTEADAGSSRASPLVRAPVDLVEEVTLAFEEIASLAEAKSIDLGLEADIDSAIVTGDRHRLHMLIVNLLDNAIRYIAVGGVVTVRIAMAIDGRWTMTVIDDGPGIPERERERVFERFYRLPATEADGCGLGLAIVREVALAHGATWTLGAPETGSGLVVTIRFPP